MNIFYLIWHAQTFFQNIAPCLIDRAIEPGSGNVMPPQCERAVRIPAARSQ